MINDHPPSARVSVVVRDASRLAELIRSQRSYKFVGDAAGVSAALIGEIALGRLGRVHLATATALERALKQRPGSLFQVDPDTVRSLRPYLK
ncbi:MAG: hypothetical protein ACRDXB_00645 [Actinomycetes bacterium]